LTVSPEHARLVIAISATAAPHPADRAHGIVLVATEVAVQKRPAWWQWTVWLAAAITCHKIERIRACQRGMRQSFHDSSAR